MMNDYKLPIIEPTIDYTKVPPINQKRTISFVNHFIIHTVTFLNKFAMSCEEKLCEFENRLQRIEASLEILQSWLSSVPALDQDVKEAINNIEKSDESKESVETEVSKIDEPDNSIENEPKKQETEEQPKSRDPRYEHFFRMANVGVPKQAIKLQMQLQGLDPSVLDDPQQVVSKPQSTDNVASEGN